MSAFLREKSFLFRKKIFIARKEKDMKKKFLAVLLVLSTFLFAFQMQAYASSEDFIAPQYAGVSMVSSYMDIDGPILIYTIDVVPFDNDTLDRVHIEAELKTLGGKVIKSYDEDLDEGIRLFTFSKRRAVSEEATYYLKYTLTCYKNGKLIDTISKTTRTATYTR